MDVITLLIICLMSGLHNDVCLIVDARLPSIVYFQVTSCGTHWLCKACKLCTCWCYSRGVVSNCTFFVPLLHRPPRDSIWSKGFKPPDVAVHHMPFGCSFFLNHSSWCVGFCLCILACWVWRVRCANSCHGCNTHAQVSIHVHVL